MNRNRMKVVAVLMSTVFSLGLLEGGLRGAGYFAERSFWREVAARAAGDPVVLCLGESTTGGLWCNYQDSYPAQLEGLLRASGHPRAACVVPPHVGQNTSQMAHRIDRYLAAFHPRVVLLMCGVNDSWSVDETDAGEFDPAFATSRLDSLKIVKLARLTSLRLTGDPVYSPWPPEHGYVEREACRRLWRHEVGRMIRATRASGATPILMTYPRYAVPPLEDVLALARDEWLAVVRNDLSFVPFDPALFFEDRAHPRPAGYRIVAENANACVCAALR